MKKTFQVGILFILTAIAVSASVKMIRSASELNGLIVNCHTDYSIIIELPVQSVIEKMEMEESSASGWTVDHDLNLLWAQPVSPEARDCSVRIKTDSFNDVILTLRNTKDPGELIHTIVLKEELFTKKNAVVIPQKSVEPVTDDIVVVNNEKTVKETGIRTDPIESKREIKLDPAEYQEKTVPSGKRIMFEKYFSLQGGTSSFSDGSFLAEGEGIFAGRNKKGIMFQIAGKITLNPVMNDFGFSAGGGYEPSGLGVFLFLDALSHRYGESPERTLHAQARSAVRYRVSDGFYLSAFLALPLTGDQFTGLDTPGNPDSGFYDRALLHGGIDFSGILKNFIWDFRGIFSEGSAFGIELRAAVRILKNLFLAIDLIHSQTGKYSYLDGVTNSTRVSAGLVFNNIGKGRNTGEKIILRPDYPMVVSVEKEKDGGDMSGSPSITLSADPVQGYAPLNVSYLASYRGFKGNVEMTWHFNSTYSSTSSNTDSAFTYTVPGTYECYVEGRDTHSNYAKSNVVSILVMDTAGTSQFTILSSVTAGEGAINPKGTTVVSYQADQTYQITPAAGWHINKVLMDGKGVGVVTEYTFKQVSEDHTISVEFSQSPPSTYTINASAGPGGSVDPESTQVIAGDNATFTVTCDEGYEVDQVKVDGNTRSISGNEITIENIQADHTIEVTFKLKTYAITTSVRNNQYGSIDPPSAAVTHGSSITLNLTPEDGNKEAVRYWLNGQLTSSKGVTSVTLNNIKSNQHLEVEFDWKYYEVRVRLFLEDNKTIGSVDPGTGTFTERAGSNLTFNFITGESSKVVDVVVNGQSKGEITTFKIYDLGRDEQIDVYMKRREVPIEIANVGGCGANVTCSNGQSGINKEYKILHGDDVTFYFDLHDEVTYDWWWSIDRGPAQQMGYNPQHTFYNVTGPHNIRIKCVLAGQPKPEF